MATNNQRQITWGGNNSTSVGSGGSSTSDKIDFPDGVVQATAILKADHGGTPGSGDEMEFIFLLSAGDPDGSSTEEFSTQEHSFAVFADTNLEDPARVVVELPMPLTSAKLVANNQADNSITVSGSVLEQTV